MGRRPFRRLGAESLEDRSMMSGSPWAAVVAMGPIPAPQPAIIATVKAPVVTTTVISSSLNPSYSRFNLAIYATVKSATGTPYGTVFFYDGSTYIGSATVNITGVAQLSLPNLADGVHYLRAVFQGNNDYRLSTSLWMAQKVQDVLTSTAVAPVGVTTLVTGQTFSLQATVSPYQLTLGRPTGTVVFKDGATTLGSAALDLSGKALLTGVKLSAGTHAITASYQGAVWFDPSDSKGVPLFVKQASTSTSVASSSPSGLAGQSSTFTTKVLALPPGSGVPTGTVSFFDGNTLLGTGTLNASGTASLSIALSAGLHKITVQYLGDANYLASLSAILQYKVQ